MNIYVDFDRTLFNCDQFLIDFYAIIDKYEIPRSIFKRCQIQCKKQGFNPQIILDCVLEKHHFSNQIYQDINHLLKNTKKYLYDDTIPFLKYLKKCGYQVIILTKGNEEYQKEKILNSHIKSYYDQLIVTMNHKGNLNIDYPNSIFIDDNPMEIKGVLKKKAKMIIRIKRKNSKYSNILIEEKIKSVSSLTEIIEKNILK